ncbi:MAG: hypothetical protein ACK5LS_02635 [Propioniciclava sp.]
MRVEELRALLDLYPGELDVVFAAHTRVGVDVDVASFGLIGVSPSLGDDGEPTSVWVLGCGEPAVRTPALFVVACRCGQTVVTGDGQPWPDDHLSHLGDPGR